MRIAILVITLFIIASCVGTPVDCDQREVTSGKPLPEKCARKGGPHDRFEAGYMRR